jgi:hypothetical protein
MTPARLWIPAAAILLDAANQLRSRANAGWRLSALGFSFAGKHYRFFGEGSQGAFSDAL